jgi:hypothetical protein
VVPVSPHDCRRPPILPQSFGVPSKVSIPSKVLKSHTTSIHALPQITVSNQRPRSERWFGRNYLCLPNQIGAFITGSHIHRDRAQQSVYATHLIFPYQAGHQFIVAFLLATRGCTCTYNWGLPDCGRGTRYIQVKRLVIGRSQRSPMNNASSPPNIRQRVLSVQI